MILSPESVASPLIIAATFAATVAAVCPAVVVITMVRGPWVTSWSSSGRIGQRPSRLREMMSFIISSGPSPISQPITSRRRC